MKLLLEFGADPKLEDTVGVSPLGMSTGFPAMEALFTASFRKSVKKERKSAKKNQDFKKCEGCKSEAGKRCTGNSESQFGIFNA